MQDGKTAYDVAREGNHYISRYLKPVLPDLAMTLTMTMTLTLTLTLTELYPPSQWTVM